LIVILGQKGNHALTFFYSRRDAICGLIMGSPPGKVYSKLRSVTQRLNSS